MEHVPADKLLHAMFFSGTVECRRRQVRAAHQRRMVVQ